MDKDIQGVTLRQRFKPTLYDMKDPDSSEAAHKDLITLIEFLRDLSVFTQNEINNNKSNVNLNRVTTKKTTIDNILARISFTPLDTQKFTFSKPNYSNLIISLLHI
jgi:hypothetical protein